MTKIIRDFVANESGATAIEYGLIAAGLAVAVIGAANALGTEIDNTFGRVETQLKNAGTAP